MDKGYKKSLRAIYLNPQALLVMFFYFL